MSSAHLVGLPAITDAGNVGRDDDANNSASDGTFTARLPYPDVLREGFHVGISFLAGCVRSYDWLRQQAR
jgi:hypothetical protein